MWSILLAWQPWSPETTSNIRERESTVVRACEYHLSHHHLPRQDLLWCFVVMDIMNMNTASLQWRYPQFVCLWCREKLEGKFFHALRMSSKRWGVCVVSEEKRINLYQHNCQKLHCISIWNRWESDIFNYITVRVYQYCDRKCLSHFHGFLYVLLKHSYNKHLNWQMQN